MSAFKVTFIICGLIYSLIAGWGVFLPGVGVFYLGLFGIVLCFSGWKLTDRYL